jgi:hypothetical protein
VLCLGVGLCVTLSSSKGVFVAIRPRAGLRWRCLRDAAAERRADGMKAAGVERRYGFAGGKSSEGENPMSATGMKQGWKTGGGANRQEGAKPCRRTVPG